MASGGREPPGRLAVPPPQHNFEDAATRGLAAVRAQRPEQLRWLGARPSGEGWAVKVLDDLLTVELEGGSVRASAGGAVGPWWRVLTLHYLGVAGQRVIERLCHTAGRDEQTFRRAAEVLGGVPATDGDAGFDFQVYPRVRLRLVWYAGDEELPPSAVLLLPANIESFFCVEDTVVLSERLVSRLGGGRF